jgi:hypothetical protein
MVNPPDIFYYKPQEQAAQPTIIYYKAPVNTSLQKASFKLIKNQSIVLGEGLFSGNKLFQFTLQKQDGNLVLYKGKEALWDANTQGQGGVRLIMQDDGNLVLYTVGMQPIWASGTQGHLNAFFQIQDDGNAVVYEPPQTPLWETRTWGGVKHDESGGWLSDIVSAAGKPFAAVAHSVADAWTSIADKLGEIPLIGPGLQGLLILQSGPFLLTDKIISGERLDRALIQEFRDKIAAIREVAPYAQTIIAFVPGIGSGVSAAIGAGLAIAQGAPLDEAILEGVKSAVPGGALGRAVYGLALNAATGKNLIKSLGDVGVDSLGLPPAAAEGLHKALNVAYAAAKGDNIPQAALQEARGYIPAEAQEAFDIAIAMAQGKRLQDALMSGLTNLVAKQKDQIMNLGKSVIQESPAIQAISRNIDSANQFGRNASNQVKQGFEMGLGMMRHSGVNEDNLNIVRSQLSPKQREGFDIGIGVYKTAVAKHLPSSDVAPPEETAKSLVAKSVATNPNPLIRAESMKYFLVPSATVDVPTNRFFVDSSSPSHHFDFLSWLKGIFL